MFWSKDNRETPCKGPEMHIMATSWSFMSKTGQQKKLDNSVNKQKVVYKTQKKQKMSTSLTLRGWDKAMTHNAPRALPPPAFKWLTFHINWINCSMRQKATFCNFFPFWILDRMCVYMCVHLCVQIKTH